MRRGERRRFLVGVGHGTCTCEGAAFEYIVNLEFELRAPRRARPAPRSPGSPTSTSWATSGWAACTSSGRLRHPEQHLQRFAVRRARDRLDHPCARPARSSPTGFSTRPSTAPSTSRTSTSRCCCRRSRASDSKRSTATAPTSPTGMFMPNEFMRVDADYTPKPHEQWKAGDWPRTYQSPAYANVFAAGIAFAPPHPISVPHTSPNGTADRAGAPANRDAVGHDRQGGGPQHRRHDRRREDADPYRLDGRDGRRVRGLRRRQPLHRDGRLDDRLPDRARLRALPRVRPRPRTGRSARSAWPDTGSRSCCITCFSTRRACVPAGA